MNKNLGFHLIIIPDIRLGHCPLESSLLKQHSKEGAHITALFVGEFAHLGTADLSAAK
jgi:hypothetical protein